LEATVAVFGVIGFLVFFVFIKFPPDHENKRLISAFNTMVLAVCALLCLVWVFYARATWMGTDADKWWKYLALGGALLIEAGFLGICFLFRNFWVFRGKNYRGGFRF
jgi:hypothetical protein